MDDVIEIREFKIFLRFLKTSGVDIDQTEIVADKKIAGLCIRSFANNYPNRTQT